MRALLWPLPLVLLGGCSLLFEPSGGPGDGGGPVDARVEDARPVDAAQVDAQESGTCPDGVDGLFNEINSLKDEDDPAVSDDGLTLFFARAETAADPADIYRAERDSRCDAWGVPEMVPTASEVGVDENNPTLGPGDQKLYYVVTENHDIYSLELDSDDPTPQQLTVFEEFASMEVSDLFVVERDGVGKIYYGSTTNRNVFQSEPEYTSASAYTFNGTETPKAANQAWVNDQENRMYFADTQGNQLYVSNGPGEGTFSEATSLEVEGLSPEDPWLTEDGWLYYAARSEEGAERDLYVTKEPAQ